MSVYVITAVHNRYAVTRRFIQELRQQTFDDLQLVLVDDGCTDGTAQMARSLFPECIILHGNGNLWWGGSLQKAYEYLISSHLNDDDIIFIANDDSHLDSRFVEKAVEILKCNPNALLTGCGYGIKTGKYLDGPINFNLKNGQVKHMPPGARGNCASTRALFLKYGVYKKLGGFHPVLLPHYGSDYEYTIRAVKKGYKIISDIELKYIFEEGNPRDNLYKNLSLRKIFSRRSRLNPFYKLTFILLIAPAYRLPAYVVYQLKRFRTHMRDNKENMSG